MSADLLNLAVVVDLTPFIITLMAVLFALGWIACETFRGD